MVRTPSPIHNRIVNLRVVYCGPTGSGKRTNLRYLHNRLPESKRTELTNTTDSKGESVLSFDFLAPPIGGWRVHGSIVAIPEMPEPGSELFRNLITNCKHCGADQSAENQANHPIHEISGIVFVADSGMDCKSTNAEALQNLIRHMSQLNLELGDGAADDLKPYWSGTKIPWLAQFNKRDVVNPIPAAEMRAAEHMSGITSIDAVASAGNGVLDTLTAMVRLMYKTSAMADDDQLSKLPPIVVD